MGFFHRHRGLTPYLLLLPGLLWLGLFFLVPLGFLGYQSLQTEIRPDDGDVVGQVPGARRGLTGEVDRRFHAWRRCRAWVSEDA